jgi:NADPH2:quinone reductase
MNVSKDYSIPVGTVPAPMGRATYRRIVAVRRGGAEVLQLVEAPLPEPAAGEARMRVLAAGVSFTDVLMREGTYLGGPRPPFTSGYDLVGEVDKVGAEVVDLAPGQRVAALTVFGADAEYICLPAATLVPVPDGLDVAEAVSLVLNYVTAYQLLHRTAHVRSGESLLVQGAAGGVGTAALQLGRLAGLEMYGTAATEKADLVAALGATPIDYRRTDFLWRLRALTSGGVDVVLDGIGGTLALRSYRALRPGGRLVLFGHYATLVGGRRDLRSVALWYLCGALLLMANLWPDRRRVLGYRIAKLRDRHPDWFRADLMALFALLAQGKIAPVIAARLPLAEAPRAQSLLGQGAVRGKIVLMMEE